MKKKPKILIKVRNALMRGSTQWVYKREGIDTRGQARIPRVSAI